MGLGLAIVKKLAGLLEAPIAVRSVAGRGTVDASAGLNVGTDSVRFPGPLPVGHRVRARAALVSCTEVTGGLQTVMRLTLEVEGAPEPACVVDAVSRWLA